MIVKLLTEHHWEFLSLNGGCAVSSESTLFKMLQVEIRCHGSNILDPYARYNKTPMPDTTKMVIALISANSVSRLDIVRR